MLWPSQPEGPFTQYVHTPLGSRRCGGLGDRTVSISTGLHSVAVDARGSSGGKATLSRLLSSIVVHVFEIEGVDVARNVASI
jgi:hypothetical protein